MTNKPMFADELLVSAADAAELLIDMIRTMLFVHHRMPPAEMFVWYVENFAYRFAAFEHMHAAGKIEPKDEIELEVLVDELAAIRKVLNTNKMFVLIEKLESILRTRKLALPLSYDASHGGRV